MKKIILFLLLTGCVAANHSSPNASKDVTLDLTTPVTVYAVKKESRGAYVMFLKQEEERVGTIRVPKEQVLNLGDTLTICY